MILQKYKNDLKPYCELRAQTNRSVTVTMVNGNVTTNYTGEAKGVCARTFRGSMWGFSSFPAQTDDAVRSVLKAAESNAEFLSGKQNKPDIDLLASPANGTFGFTEMQPPKHEAIVDFVKEIDAEIEKRYPKLKSRSVHLSFFANKKEVLTADGAHAIAEIPRTIMYFNMSADEGNGPAELYDLVGGAFYPGDLFNKRDILLVKAHEAYEHLMKKAEGIYADAGVHECVMDSALAGILAHEAVGHTVEADNVLGGAVAGDYVNQPVASPLISLVDFAHTAQGLTCPVPVYFDDEGTQAVDSLIIENGILKQFLNNKETAVHFGQKALGNARGYRFSDEPLIRMRNTAILPGKDKLQEMIESVEDGYYLMRSGNGQADATGEFMFGIILGYEIKNGKIGRALKDTTISGIAFDMLKTVSMVSDELTWSGGGTCGKKQPMTVGMGGPAVKCSISIGGR